MNRMLTKPLISIIGYSANLSFARPATIYAKQTPCFLLAWAKNLKNQRKPLLTFFKKKKNNLNTKFYFNLSEKIAQIAANQVKIQLIPGTKYYGMKTYTQAVNLSYELAKQQYKKLTLNSRIKQRQNMSNPSKYLSILTDYCHKKKSLQNQALKVIAKKFGLDDSLLQQSGEYLQKNEAQQFDNLQNMLFLKMTQSLQGKNKISQQQQQAIKQILGYQIQILEDKKDLFKFIYEGVVKKQQTATTINNSNINSNKISMFAQIFQLILNDFVYCKYQYEKEDIVNAVNQNPELAKLYERVDYHILKIMGYVGMIDPRISQSFQQSAIRKSNNSNNKLKVGKKKQKQIK